MVTKVADREDLNTKLLKIQAGLKAPKGQTNTFGKYKYRSCEDILEAVKPLCVEQGVVLTISDTIEMIGDRYYVKATATLTCEEFLFAVSAYAREQEDKKGMDAAQITGACSSYARKYALNGLFFIDDTKDADTMEPPAKKQTKAPPKQVENTPPTQATSRKLTDPEKMTVLEISGKLIACTSIEELNICAGSIKETYPGLPPHVNAEINTTYFQQMRMLKEQL